MSILRIKFQRSNRPACAKPLLSDAIFPNKPRLLLSNEILISFLSFRVKRNFAAAKSFRKLCIKVCRKERFSIFCLLEEHCPDVSQKEQRIFCVGISLSMQFSETIHSVCSSEKNCPARSQFIRIRLFRRADGRGVIQVDSSIFTLEKKPSPER